jgi:hypothetical protein
LFELGLVPSTVTSRGLLTNGPAAATATVIDPYTPSSTQQQQQQSKQNNIDATEATASTTTSYRATTTATSTELALTTEIFDQQVNNSTTNTTTYLSMETLRSLEAKAIRRQLSEHDIPPSNNKAQSKTKGRYKDHNGTENDDNDTNSINCATNLDGDGNGNDNDDNTAAWDVEHFPLSLSRYQREFKQIALLNAGAFGSVYRAIRELDGCEYAIKKITFDSIGYSNESIQRVIREVHCLATVNDHPNIVRYYTSWLEPSWMTGGNAAAGSSSTNSRHSQHLKQLQIDAQNHASPQKLLQDIENLMDSVDDEDEKIDDDDSSWSSSSGESCSHGIGDESTFKFSSRRRSSWGNNGEESSWSAYHSHQLEPWTGVYDDSYLPDRGRSARRRKSNKNKKSNPKAKQYKYQISLYIQMQLCHPATLQDWIRERNRQVPEADHASRIGPALEIFHQLCSGLAQYV